MMQEGITCYEVVMVVEEVVKVVESGISGQSGQSITYYEVVMVVKEGVKVVKSGISGQKWYQWSKVVSVVKSGISG